MKKLYCIILAVALLLSVAVFAFAEGYNFAGYTDDDLIKLRFDIDMELARRGVGYVAPQGTYQVGVDIDPGSYQITVLEDDSWSWYEITDAEDNIINDDFTELYGTYRITLFEGQFLTVNTAFAIAPAEKITF